MTNEQIEKLKRLLEESFHDVLSRELRLSAEELEYLQTKYPQATIAKMEAEEASDSKAWYLVKLVN